MENEGSQLWEKSLFIQLVDDLYPLVDELVSSNDSLRTTALLWNETMGVFEVINAWTANYENQTNGTLGNFNNRTVSRVCN